MLISSAPLVIRARQIVMLHDQPNAEVRYIQHLHQKAASFFATTACLGD
jgi:hypothetical protein